MAIQARLTIYDLEEAELSYAPPYGSAKDPVNFVGMVAADILRGDMPLCHWNSVDGEFLLDVRNPPELAVESVPGAVNIPLPQLRAVWANSPATVRFSSSAAPPNARTTRRASCFKTGSKFATSRAACCHVRCSWQGENQRFNDIKERSVQ